MSVFRAQLVVNYKIRNALNLLLYNTSHKEQPADVTPIPK
jgi:hypothetical protein